MKVAHLSEPAEERVVFRDGLGVRERRDTGTGEVVEWLHLDPAFAGAEIPLRERVTRLSKLQHVKFARILGLEPSRKDRGPILVSSHVVGTRLIDALEMAGHGLVAFDPGAGLQVTREVLGALAVLHDSRNVCHGALGPERVVLTPTGRVVMVEHVLAQALDRMQRPRHQLWREWRIATPPAAGPVRFDTRTDLAQAGVVALALLLGRPIDEEEYPHRLRGLLPLVQDRIGNSPAAAIAADVVAWLERLAPVDSRRAFKTVREAQQAFEALVSGGATAMGITHARVKGVLTAIAGLASAPPAPAPVEPSTSRAQEPASSMRTKAPEPVQEPGPVALTVNADVAVGGDGEIDIEALLALEAELEGGTSAAAPAAPFERHPLPSPPLDQTPTMSAAALAMAAPTVETQVPAPLVSEPLAVEFASTEPTAPELVAEHPASVALEPIIPASDVVAPMDVEPALDALAQERLDLERQFAALVDTVAPADAAPVHLIPETPLTSEPLVDARVRWSSMPADVTDPAETGIGAEADDWALSMLPRDLTVDDVPEAAREPLPEAAPEALEVWESVEPFPVSRPEETWPAATVEHAPSEWWKDALPWRVQEQASAQDVIEPLEIQAAREVPDVADAAPTEVGAGENFGDLSLDDIEARATNVESVGEAEVDAAVEVHAALNHDAPTDAAIDAVIDAAIDEPADAPTDAPVEPEAVECLAETAVTPVELVADVVVVAAADAVTPSVDVDEPIPESPSASFVLLAQEQAALEAADDEPLVQVTLPVHAGVDADVDDVLEVLEAEEVIVPDPSLPFAVEDDEPALEAVGAGAPVGRLDADLDISMAAAIEVPAELALAGGPDASSASALDDLPVADTLQDHAPVVGDAWDGPLEMSGPLVVDTADLTFEATAAADHAPDHAVESDHLVGVPEAPMFADVGPAVVAEAEAEAPSFNDASPLTPANFGSDEAMAPVSGYRLFDDIAPIILQEDADLSALDASSALHATNDAPRAAASSLLGRAGGADDTAGWRRTFLDVRPHDVPASDSRGEFFSDRSTGAVADVDVETHVDTEVDAHAHADAAADESSAVWCDHESVAAARVDAPETQVVEPLFASAIDVAEAGADVAGDVANEPIAIEPLAIEPIENEPVAIEPIAIEPIEIEFADTAVSDVELPDAPDLVFAEAAEATLDRTPATLLESVPEPVQEAAPAPVSEPEAEPSRDEHVEQVVEPAVETATGDAEPLETPAAVPSALPEVVIVDDDLNRDAWDHLPWEGPARDEPDPASGQATVVGTAAAASAPKKKRRRARRKKGGHTERVAPRIVTAPIVALPTIAAPIVALPVVPASVHETTSAPVALPLSAASVEIVKAAGEKDSPRSRSLLDREVPEWTPPSDLRLIRPRAPSSPSREIVASLESPAEVGPDAPTVAVTGAAVAPGDRAEAGTPARLAAVALVPSSGAGPISNPMTVPADVGPSGHAAVVGLELRPFEQEIRAVGMPDLDALESRSARTSGTSMADAHGSTSGATPRQTAAETRGLAPTAVPDSSRGMNWRRAIAASVLIALFQGAAFAAWWWVQPGARGTLVVQTGKRGVEVLLDDKVVGRTPFREEVVPGRHKLGLRQGTAVREMPVEISVGVVTTQAIDWPSSAGGKGSLQIASNPAGAEVFINGKSRGTAPLLLEDLPAGDQSVTMRSDAGSVTVNATVLPDETTPLEVKIFAGWIQVDAPVEVNLLLRGREKIGSSMDGQILLPPGTHRVQAVNDALGIRQWLTVTVEPGAVRRVPFTVKPATLTLQEEAEVFVDGASAGSTPGTIRIAPGTHDLSIRQADGTERRQAMTVRSGQRIEF